MSVVTAPEITVERSPDYRTIIVNGVFGGHQVGYFSAVIYTDEQILDEVLSDIEPKVRKPKIKRTLQCRLVFDPIQAKSIVKWLQEHVDSYEKTFHEIPTGPKETQQKGPPSTTYG